MSLTPERQLAHARAIRARGNALPPEGVPAAVILDSWARCMQQGLDSGARLLPPVVEAADLAQRRERAEVTRRLAQAELETLSQQIAGSNFLLAFADSEGVILDLYADNRFSMSGSDAGILPGSCWQESLCGTNGLGTALAAGHSVAVTGMEHYLLKLGDVSCTATPVRDHRGEIVGVLDASSYFESRQRHTQALVQMAATHIENGLMLHQMRGHLVLAVHPRPEFLGTMSAGLLAFDEGGRLLALNARGVQLMQGLDPSPGCRFESLFDERFEEVLARLTRGGDWRLRDVLGSSLMAVLVGRPLAARRAAPAAAPVLVPPAVVGPALAAPQRQEAAAGARAATPPRPAAAVANKPAPPGPADFGPQDPLRSDDPAVMACVRTVNAAVRLKAPLLILGETGSGKEAMARHAHRASGRSGALVAVNCAALPAELFEAELFGHVGGAFTGSRREGNLGLIASAHGGTLLLDEVRDLPLPLQAALLRFLDDQMLRPVGGTSARRVDVQLLAASNVDLADEVAARRFRADLLFRLDTVRVTLPPLRLRRDFAAAARGLLRELDPSARLSEAALARLSQHHWPGNFRELRAVLTRALMARDDGRLDAADVDGLLPAAGMLAGSALQQGASELVRREFERTRCVSQTSRNLGISRTTVYRHLRSASP